MRAMMRKRSTGQALVESALALPFVLLLLTGGAQVGTIAYGAVSVDTAAREGARVGSESPNTSLTTIAALAGGKYTCKAPSTETNPICTSVYTSAGLLNAGNLTVTITAPVSLSMLAAPADVQQLGQTVPNLPNADSGSGCNGAQTTVTGNVTYAGSAVPNSWDVVVSSSNAGSSSNVTVVDGTYSACFPHTDGQQTASISGLALASPDGCTYSASVSGLTFPNNGSVTQDLVLTQANCPVTSSSTSSDTSSTPTSTDTGTISVSPTATTTLTCPTSQTVAYPAYFTVTVSYPVPIFVPFVNKFLADSNNGGQRTMTTTVTAQVVPCSVSAGQ